MVRAEIDNGKTNNLRITTDFLGNSYANSCLGCAIASGDMPVPGGIVYNGKSIVVGADPEIPIPGFMIVTSKRHIRSFSDLSKQERDEIGDAISLAEKAIKELYDNIEITLIQEERSSHFHIWIFPMYKWMIEKFGNGMQNIRSISQYVKENFDENTINEIYAASSRLRNYFENMRE